MSEPSNDSLPTPRFRMFGRLMIWFVVGGAIGLAGMALVVRVINRDKSLPPLTANGWAAARDRWAQANVENYDIEIAVTGRQAATYAVSVRGGAAIKATRNGSPLPQQRTWATWTVEGMFETIARDLDSVERHASGRADRSTPNLQLRAVFHPELGYPQRYLRTEIVRLGANPEVSWTVSRFQTAAP